MKTPGTRARPRAAAALVVATFVAAGGLLTAAPASAEEPSGESYTENGGAARNDDDRAQALRDSILDSDAKNVIVIIGDGMGDSEITVARNYAEGAGGELAGIDALPLTGSYTTWSVTEDGAVDYASESASTASAWSTGTKAVDGSLSVDVNGTPQATLLELAKANGLKTGNVSTAEIQDATPAAEYAHISKRGCYGPEETSIDCADEALENGGLGSVSEQLLDARPDVTLGGGSATFDQVAAAGQWEGLSLFDQAEARGYQLVRDAAELDAVVAADQTSPVLGLFTEGNFPVRWQGPEAAVGGGDLEPQSCTENPERLESGLSLGSLTSKAIDLLDGEDGFFLQVEGASIDKRDHAADACGQIGETVDLDEAVQVALSYAQEQGDTLVVVTADHAHTSQIVGSTPPGLSANLLTEEGQNLIVSYGTAVEGESQQHTGSQVRIAAYGPGAANVVGLTDQTDLFFTASGALSLNRDAAALSASGTASADVARIAPGEEFTVSVADLYGDRQVAAVAGAETDLGEADIIDGAASFTVTAPDEPGSFTVALTGTQTGTALAVEVDVADGAAPAPAPSETPTPEATEAPSPGETPESEAGLPPGDSRTPPLNSTGGTVSFVLAGAALTALAAGGLLTLRRRGGLAGKL
ncbi:alkaline phosphatase [Microbacterium betulae]|uniref:Alkaline phosphatase n=1 Tax=Microbacterium betulae TaxID=2981139 RepID=A0AA97FKM9_9MICO|nr:alkaline phosphatase [Microbacterium sp. AB]WOF23212.1 alkaline phosphatase [Microbacterium sp. AB]